MIYAVVIVGHGFKVQNMKTSGLNFISQIVEDLRQILPYYHQTSVDTGCSFMNNKQIDTGNNTLINLCVSCPKSRMFPIPSM